MSLSRALVPFRRPGLPARRAAESSAPRPELAPILPPTGFGGAVLGLVVIAAGFFGGIGYWAATAPIESAVVAPGEIEVDGRLRVVQHLEGGMVSEILVHEGARVEAGQVLARLDGTRSEAQLGILRSQLAEGLAREARLAAEYAGAATLAPSPELAGLIAARPEFNGVLEAQREIFRSSRDSDAGEAAILAERIEQLSRQREETALERGTLTEQLALVTEDLQGLKKLYEDGLLQKQRYLARLDSETELRGRIARVDSRDEQLLREIAEVRQRVLQVERGRRQSIAAEQQEVRASLLDLRQRLSAMQDIEERLEIRAPEAGRVLGLQLNTVGEVIAGGEDLMKIVPERADYVVAARVSPNDIDQVAEGGPARVRLSAYSARSTPLVEGRVRSVSADRLVDEASGRPYYAIDVTLDPESLAAIEGVETLPGMSAQVMVTGGSRTVLGYLFDPILRGMETAMIEPD